MSDEQAKKPKKTYGITPYAIALVYEGRTPAEDRDTFYADNPSVYAEARLGVASRAEAEQAFNKLIDDILAGRCKTDLPFLKKWIEEKNQKLAFDDLEARIQKKNKTKAASSSEGVGKINYSPQGTFVAGIRARSSAKEGGTLSYWDVSMANFEISDNGLNPVFWRKCQCGFDSKTNNKRRLWENTRKERKFLENLLTKKIINEKDISRPLDLACYHKAVASTYIELARTGQRLKIPRLNNETTVAFDLIGRWDLVFEDAARKYRYRQQMAERDEFLWHHDIVSDKFKEYMERGLVKKELIKGRRFFEPVAKQIIMAIYEKMHSLGYKFRGFSREFMGFKNESKTKGYKNNFESAGIVFEKDMPDKSYRIVYAPEAKIWNPIIVEHTYVNPELRKIKPRRAYKNHPLRLFVEKKAITTLDDRTGKYVETRIFIPSEDTLSRVSGSESRYKKWLGYFKNKN